MRRKKGGGGGGGEVSGAARSCCYLTNQKQSKRLGLRSCPDVDGCSLNTDGCDGDAAATCGSDAVNTRTCTCAAGYTGTATLTDAQGFAGCSGPKVTAIGIVVAVVFCVQFTERSHLYCCSRLCGRKGAAHRWPGVLHRLPAGAIR